MWGGGLWAVSCATAINLSRERLVVGAYDRQERERPFILSLFNAKKASLSLSLSTSSECVKRRRRRRQKNVKKRNKSKEKRVCEEDGKKIPQSSGVVCCVCLCVAATTGIGGRFLQEPVALRWPDGSSEKRL